MPWDGLLYMADGSCGIGVGGRDICTTTGPEGDVVVVEDCTFCTYGTGPDADTE